MKPAKGLRVTELIEGTGDEIAEGSTIRIACECVRTGGDEVYRIAAEDPAGVIVEGLRDCCVALAHGVIGMRFGGRRKIISPPQLNDVERSIFPELAEGETLVYTVEAISQEHGRTS